MRRTHTGAWIETAGGALSALNQYVAPTRVRGLKLKICLRMDREDMSHPHGCVD